VENRIKAFADKKKLSNPSVECHLKTFSENYVFQRHFTSNVKNDEK
jgi:hypothetical protein